MFDDQMTEFGWIFSFNVDPDILTVFAFKGNIHICVEKNHNLT